MKGGSYGPKPWLQRHWDARAALNFMLGGTGAGLLLVTPFGAPSEAALRAGTVLGLALIAAGLASVWLEIGRPLRAVHVFFNPFTSWMTRESFAALVVFALGLATLLVARTPLPELAALAALGFVYCQARILYGAKGIPAWRAASVIALIPATALAEGAGLYLVLAPVSGAPTAIASLLCAVALAARWLAAARHRAALERSGTKPARAALDSPRRLLVALGTVAPLGLLAVGWLSAGDVALAATALAGALAVVAGWHFKFALVTRAAYNQGFALPRIPVRGRR